MDTLLLTRVKNHPKYEETIEEILQGIFNPSLMELALTYSKSESQAQAIYVLLKLGNKE